MLASLFLESVRFSSFRLGAVNTPKQASEIFLWDKILIEKVKLNYGLQGSTL